MTKVLWLLAVEFVTMAAVACSGPDIPVVENGSAEEAAGGTANQAGGSQSKGGTAGAATGGANSNGAGGGTKAIGGLPGTGGDSGGRDAAGGTTGAAGDEPGLGGSASGPGCKGPECTDQFDCGTQLKCGRSTTYCAVTPTSGDSAEYVCVAIPNQCLINGNSLCSCLAKDSCTSCTESFGAVTLTCPP